MIKNYSLENILLKGIFFGIVAAMLSPLLTYGGFLYPGLTTKVYYFQIIVGILTGMYISLLVINPAYRPRLTPLVMAVSLFFAIQLLTTFTGINPLKSFWGSVERLFGFWNTLHFFIFFIICTSVIKTKKHWQLLITTMVAVSAIVSLYAVIQYLKSAGVSATFGNPTFLDSYLVFHIFLALWLLIENKNLKIKLPLALLVITQIAVISLTNIRGPFIGIIVGLTCLGIYFAVTMKIKREFLFGGAILLSFLIYGLLTANWSDGQIFQRLTHISLQDPTTMSRLNMWTSAWQGFLERPFLGWGVENYSTVFSKYYQPQFFATNVAEGWSDVPHNIFLQYLVDGGVLLLIAFLAVGVVLSLQLWGKKNAHISPALKMIISMSIVTYGVQGFFELDTFASYLPLFFILALVNALPSYNDATTIDASHKTDTTHLGTWKITAIATVSLLAVFVISYGTIIPARSNYLSVASMQNLVDHNVSAFKDSYKKLKESLFLSPFQRSEYIRIIAEDFYRKTAYFKFSADLTNLLSAFVADLYSEWKMQPGNIRLAYSAITISNRLSSLGVSTFTPKAEEMISAALLVNPNRQPFLLQLADIKMLAGDNDAAIEIYKKIVSIDPSAAMGHFFLGEALMKLKKYDEAILEYDVAIKLNFIVSSVTSLVGMANTYAKFPTRLDDAKKLYIRALGLSPNDSMIHGNLAYVYGLLGDKDNAIKEATIASALDPSRKETFDKFIAQLNSAKKLQALPKTR
jgi:O-antigen ligase/tetratricopeptide (TPR) repeat protein